MQVTKQLIDEFENFCESIDRPPLGCEFDFKEQKYRPRKGILAQDFNNAYHRSQKLTFGLEVWLREREQLAAKIGKIIVGARRPTDAKSIIFVNDLPVWLWVALQASQPQEQGE